MDHTNKGFQRLPAGRPGSVMFTVDGLPASAPAGEPLASALASLGYQRLRVSPRDGTPRGAFCFMGVCQECVLHVDGVLRQACLTPVTAGMAVELRGVP